MSLLRNPRVPLALVQKLLTCVFRLKSLVIVTPRYWMLLMFSRSVPSKVYEAWIFLIRFLVSCIILHLTGWNLIPHFLAYEANWSISLLSFIVSTSSLISRQHSHQQNVLFQTQYLMRCHLCTERITRDQEWCPGGYPTKPEPNQILLHLFQCLSTNSTAKQFAFKEFMRRCIKCLFKIQYECVNLSSTVQEFSSIIYYRSQLSFTTMSFPECMLPIWQEFIFIKMSHDIWTYYVFE